MKVDIEKALDFMRDNAGNLANAKADRVHLEQFRKSKKALLMQQVEGAQHIREAYAYAHPEYIELLDGLKVAVEEEERLKWMMVAAQTKCEIWRTIEASNRRTDRAET